ncbi:MAG: glycoside hydrolase family 2 TIM barrel-domain containing protein [Longimicrobiales bacterium]
MMRRAFVRRVLAVGASAALRFDQAVAGIGPAPDVRSSDVGSRAAIRLDTGWRFLRDDAPGAQSPDVDDHEWERVLLPHTARLEALVTGEPGSDSYQWQGLCWYRRRLEPGEDLSGKKLFLKFEAAMNVADVWLDGELLGRHMGGWLPFVFDITDRVRPGTSALLAVRLDNTDNPITGPKPLHLLDFNTYGGLYRYVHLIAKNRLHITDPIFADRPGSGGVFVTYPEVRRDSALVRVQTHVRNDHATARMFGVRTTLIDSDGAPAVAAASDPVVLAAGEETEVVQRISVDQPRLWSPRAPALYTVRSEIVSEGRVVDAEHTRVGIRRIEISRDGFRINGERMFLRGTNRHQEHPYVGYAVPEAAQYRDARRIKDGGFDYIRLSHYPHSPAFMDACDELGLVVMDCIPGWQYFGEDPAFAQLQYRNCRDLIRRDRNHPCVILWEVSLNETAMPPEFVETTHRIAHEEYPGDQTYTCGWLPGYDVYIRARQHGGCAGVDVPCVVSEYGDWEYYAMTAGLNQQDFHALTPDESNSRQLRWHGERALLQQARNFQEAHDDNLAGPAFADGLWVMFDYNRGYAPDIESSGCMDLFRLPKYSYWFFRSQRSPYERLPNAASGPMVFIASEWTPASAMDVRVFSNCDEVELRLNGQTVARRGPDHDRISAHLPHPPFTFPVGVFAPGTLEAIGYLFDGEAARHEVRTPGVIESLRLYLDGRGRAPARAGKDIRFAHAALEDAAGAVVPDAWENVAFGATGDATLIGIDPFSSDAGIASILVETRHAEASAALYALAVVRGEQGVRILASADAFRSANPTYEIRYTADGGAPGPGSARYVRPITGAARVRAALIADGRVVAALDEATRKFRIPGSTAPERREPFHR